MDKSVTRGIRFQRGVYRFLRVTAGPAFNRLYQYSYTPGSIQADTFLLLSNHNTDYDPICCVISTRRHMKFVANEKLLQSFGGWFLRRMANPIPRRRGADSRDVIRLIHENLQQGISVAMYAEGFCSWDGATGYISPRTAQLAKDSGVALVTYRMDGGYLKYPHWAAQIRKGPIHGTMVREYSPQELSTMSVEEVYQAICRDLYVDAYAYQKDRMDRYICSRPAEHLELACYICPKCHRIGKLHSHGDKLTCECGHENTYNAYGLFEGEEPFFKDTLQWSRWQKQWLMEHAPHLQKMVDEPILVNKELLIRCNRDHRGKKLVTENGELWLFGDRLEIRELGRCIHTLQLQGVTKIGSFMNNRLFMTCDDTFYEFHAHGIISGYQYEGLWRILTGKNYV